MLIAALVLAASAASPTDDRFGPPPLPGSAAAVVQALVFDQPGADAAARARIAFHPHASAAETAAIDDAACRRLKIRSLYAQAAAACGGERGPATMTTVLRDAPPLRVHGPGRAALAWNLAGTLSAAVTVHGVTQPWIMDTGAQISTLPQSTAAAMGVRLLPGAIEVGTSTRPTQGRVGIIDRLEIGGATAENVPVLVLPDAMLTIDGGKGGGPGLIPGILGLPVFTAFRRVAFTSHLSQLQLGDAAPLPGDTAAALYWRQDGIGVPVTMGGTPTGFLLDTGANLTDLGPSGAEKIFPAEQAAARDKEVHVGGAGGVVVRRLRSWPTVSLRLAGAPVQLHGVALDPSQRGGGRLGIDAARNLSALILDLEHMRLSATPGDAADR